MSIQAVVSHRGLRRPVVPAASVKCAGRSGRIYFSCAGVQSDNYWSSTTNADNTDNAWNVNLNNGNVNNDDKTNTNYVWPVRGGEWWSCCPYHQMPRNVLGFAQQISSFETALSDHVLLIRVGKFWQMLPGPIRIIAKTWERTSLLRLRFHEREESTVLSGAPVALASLRSSRLDWGNRSTGWCDCRASADMSLGR